jgi:hypothetical protein
MFIPPSHKVNLRRSVDLKEVHVYLFPVDCKFNLPTSGNGELAGGLHLSHRADHWSIRAKAETVLIRRYEPLPVNGIAPKMNQCAGEVVAERTSREFTWSDGISFGEGILITA